MTGQNLTDLFVPHVTPFTDDGELDEDSLVSLVERIDAVSNLGGLVSCARIGEGPVLEWSEKQRVFETVAEAKSPDTPLVASIAPGTTEEAIEKVNAVEAAGADAAMIFPPLLFAWGQVEGEFKVQFWKDVADATDLPLVLFQVPIQSYWYSAETVRRISLIDSVAAFKDASFNVMLFTETVRKVQEDGGDMNILTGNDRFVAQSFMFDIEGALIGVSNVATQAWADLCTTAADREYKRAMDIQDDLHGIKETIFAEPIVEAPARLKYCLREQGVIESDAVRRPQLGISDEEQSRLRTELEGFEQIEL